MKFEEWFLNNGIPLDDDFNVAKRAYEAGASSRQAEIDALQVRLEVAESNLNNTLKFVREEQSANDALQKRIDELEAKREGFVLVPKKCTNNMAHAAKSVDARLSVFKYSDVWDAMLSAVEVQNNGL